ncbi:SDR family oxidoreductase [Kineosporiaceae bacterium SCSIO 59966]|nr:SDR family oxidoreductase [Kineosporiaceae bacterium SCSIO 59966]
MPVLDAAADRPERVALVTGAGSPTGIGVACARALAETGAAVVLAATTDRVHDRVAELTAAGWPAAGVVGDLTDERVAEAVVAQARQQWGRLDVVVNNAGMVSASDPDYQSGTLDRVPVSTWHASLRRNLDTAFLVTRAALPALRAADSGRVVMVASVTGAVMAMRGEVPYAAAKAGLVGLTRALAVDLAADGITVNAVAPGWIATGSQTAAEALEGRSTPLGRSGTPQEVASAVCWLASPGAGYVTGQLLVVDGGASVAEERVTGG